MDCSTPGFPVLQPLLELAQTHVHWIRDAIQQSYTLSSPSPPALSCLKSFPASGSFLMTRLFAPGDQKYWSFSFSISPSNEYSGLISFRIDWFDPFAIRGIPKSLLKHHNSKASVLRCSAVFMVQLSHPYMTTGKTIALTTWTFFGKVMSLFFNILSRMVIAFLPRSKHLLMSCLQPPSAVILEPKKINYISVSLFPHLFAMKWWDQTLWS